MERDRELVVYVPDPDAEGLAFAAVGVIRPGSAIVGDAEDGEANFVTVDYEGDVYGGHPTFEDKLVSAGSRHIWNYPTVARVTLPSAALKAVGSYDTATRRLVVHDPEPLASWQQEA